MGLQAYEAKAESAAEAEPWSLAFACGRLAERVVRRATNTEGLPHAEPQLGSLREVITTPANAEPPIQQQANPYWQASLPELPRLGFAPITGGRPASTRVRRAIKLWRSAPALARRAAWVILFCLAIILVARWSKSARLSSSIEQALRNRAAIDLRDDFRYGLSNWEGGKDWAKGWSYDNAGFIHPGKLALFRPSLALQDYQFDFLGQVERRSLSWVFRAADMRNYYVTKIAIDKPGPLPTAVLLRYAVVDGRVQDRKQFPLPLSVRSDTIYRVRVAVTGNQFTTLVNGQIVDTWSDTRLRRGGVGFFADSGEAWRLHSLQLTDRDDFLGRMCAYLVSKLAAFGSAGSKP